ncbi:Pentatricopeptide repeat-containing protein [Drosera capensis]
MGIHWIGEKGPLFSSLGSIRAHSCLGFVFRSCEGSDSMWNRSFVRRRSSLALQQWNWSSSSDEESFFGYEMALNFGEKTSNSVETTSYLEGLMLNVEEVPLDFEEMRSNFEDGVIGLDNKEVVEVLRGLRRDPRAALVYFARVKGQGFRHGVETYVAMMRILCSWGWERKLDDLLMEIIRSDENDLSFEMFELIETVVEIVEIEEQSCLVLVLDGLVKAYASLGMFDDSLSMFFLTRKPKFGPSIRSLNFLMNCLIKCGMVDETFSLYQQINKKGLSPNVYTYNLLIKAVCRQGAEAYREQINAIGEHMKAAGVSPNEFTYTIIIEGYCLQQRSNEGYDLLKEVRTDEEVRFDSFPYNILIHGFCNEMKLSEAEAVLADMETQGLTHTTYSFGPLIHAYCMRNNYERAKSIHDEMERKGVKTNCVILSSMIRCLGSKGSICEVLDLFEHYKNSGLFFDKVLYNVVVDVLCKSGRVDEARELLVEMERQQLLPDLLHYSTLMNGYCHQGKLIDAVDLLEKVKGQGLELDVVAYNILVSGFARFGEVKGTLDLINDMRLEGLEPHHATYDLIIVGLCISGKVTEAREFFDCIKEKCADDYSAMVSGYCAANHTEEAYKLFIKVYDQDIQLNRKSCSVLFDNLCTEKKINYAFALYKILRSQYDFPCIRMCCKLIDAFFEAGNVERAESVFNEWLLSGSIPDTVMYTIMISGYFKAKLFKKAHELFGHMKCIGVKADVKTYTVLLDGRLKAALLGMPRCHSKADQNDEVMLIKEKLWDEMKDEMREAQIEPDAYFNKKYGVYELHEGNSKLSLKEETWRHTVAEEYKIRRKKLQLEMEALSGIDAHNEKLEAKEPFFLLLACGFNSMYAYYNRQKVA